MPLEEEIQTFIEINDSQRGIDPNLIYSLKADLNFQVGTRENREKIAVQIAKKLNESAGLFKDNVFFGNAGEERKNKITLTTIVQSILDFKIVDSNNGFLQLQEQDIDKPYSTIKDFVAKLLVKDQSNVNFYKSNNGIQLILKFISLLHRNLDKNNINVTVEMAIDELVRSINNNKNSLQKKYGKAGFSSLSNIIFNYVKANNSSFNNMELEIKKLR